MTPVPAPKSFRWIAAAALLGFGVLLFDSTGGGVGGSDAAGYANTAKDILAGRVVVPLDALERLSLDDGWSPVFRPLAALPGPRPGTMVPFYPPGYPLHVAVAVLLAGWRAGPFLVSPILALASLVLTYFLARELTLSRPLAFAAAVMLAGCSPFIAHAIQPMSDVAATAWSIAAVLCALKARRKPGWAAAAGAAFGMSVLVRPSDALLILPIAFALPRRTAPWLLFAAGGLPCAVFYGLWNRAAYGSPIRTGYADELTHELRLAYFWPRVARYGWWTAIQFSPLVPLGWLGVAGDRRVPARDRALLLSWFGSVLVFYSFWLSAADNWTYGRYLLPAAPALLIGFLLCLRDSVRALPDRAVTVRGRRLSHAALATAAALAVVLFMERRVERRFRPLGTARGQVVYPNGCRRLEALAPDGRAVVVSMEFSAALRFYTKLTPVRWDYLSPEMFAVLRTKAVAHGYRVLGVVFPHESERAAAAAPGHWEFRGHVGRASLWELPPP